MGAHPTFFQDLAYVFLGAIAGGMLAWRLRQPVILGYVLAGILISPLTPGPSVKDIPTLELLAEIGVILLMFSVGLEFSPKDLLRAKWVAHFLILMHWDPDSQKATTRRSNRDISVVFSETYVWQEILGFRESKTTPNALDG